MHQEVMEMAVVRPFRGLRPRKDLVASVASPPYDDDFYLKVFKSLSENLRYEEFRNQLMSIESEGELIRVLRTME